ncbi:MAG: nucleotide pyrophosphohydrolase [Nitrospirae bacterium]|nr:nucleotide pyrophosphohydrolase [Nitrospirota bacterium]
MRRPKRPRLPRQGKPDAVLEALLAFRKERDWEQFHKPKDLAISLVLEAAELLEEFQWKTDAEVAGHLKDKGRKRVEEELADLAIYLKLLAHDLGIDLDEAMRKKIEKNRKKYPVEKSRGTAKKYTNL